MRSNANNLSRERSSVYSREIYDSNKNTGDDISYYQNRLGPLSTLLLTDDPSNADILQRRIRIYAIFLLCVSVFFWSWAMYNTQHLRKSNERALDLGIFSFFGTAISSFFILKMALGGSLLVCCKKKREEEDAGFYAENNNRKTGDVNHSPPGGCLRRFALMTHLIVVVNYLLGLLFAMTAGKQIYIYFASYCFTFSILWSLIAILCWNILGTYREAIRITFGDEYLNKKSKNRFGVVSICNCLLAYVYRKLTAQKNRSTTSNDDNEDEEEDIDDELRALYTSSGTRGYSNINY